MKDIEVMQYIEEVSHSLGLCAESFPAQPP